MSTQHIVAFSKTTIKHACLLFLCFVFITSFLILPIRSGAQSTGEISPQNYKNNAWANPTYAYSSNNQRTTESTSGDRVEYYNYSFGLSDDASNFKVYVNPEGYKSVLGTQAVYVLVSWNNGTNWSQQQACGFGTSETQTTLNFTSATAWTKDKLNATNFIVRVWYWQSSTCYPNNTYVISWDTKAKLWVFKNMPKIKVGDMILVRGLNGSIYLSPVKSVQVHKGTFILRDIYSGEIDVSLSATNNWTWKSHIVLTDDHPVHWYYDSKGEKEGFGIASELKVGYYFRHLFHDPPYFRNTDVPTEELYTKDFEITRIIDTKNTTTVYNVDVEDGLSRIFLKYIAPSEMEQLYNVADIKGIDYRYLFDPPPISVTIKDTGYLDWIPVQIDYEEIVWNEVEFWEGIIITRDWNSIEFWEGLLNTRLWNVIETWAGQLLTRMWNSIEFWEGLLSTRTWNIIEVWSGTVISEFVGLAWRVIETWSGQLLSMPMWLWEFGFYPLHSAIIMIIIALITTAMFIFKKEVLWGALSFSAWLIEAMLWLLIDPTSYMTALFWMAISFIMLLMTIVTQLNRAKLEKYGEELV